MSALKVLIFSRPTDTTTSPVLKNGTVDTAARPRDQGASTERTPNDMNPFRMQAITYSFRTKRAPGGRHTSETIGTGHRCVKNQECYRFGLTNSDESRPSARYRIPASEDTPDVSWAGIPFGKARMWRAIPASARRRVPYPPAFGACNDGTYCDDQNVDQKSSIST